jgi:hypothetical protein
MTIPFDIPFSYKSAIIDGSVERFGTILKDNATGKIVAHVQETGLAQEVMSRAGSSFLNPAASFGTIGSSVYSNIQLNQLTKLVEGLQVLQYATLGATVAGLGISVAGFAIMTRKLNTLQKSFDALSGKMSEQFKDIEERRLRDHYHQLRGLFTQADQAYYLKNPIDEWMLIARDLAKESSFFHGELIHLLENKAFDSDLFSNLTHSLTLCNSGRLECLVLSNELEASRSISSDFSGQYNQLFDSISPSTLTRKAEASITSCETTSEQQLRHKYLHMEELVKGVREMQVTASSNPYLIDTLIEQEIDGRAYVERLRGEKEEPVFLLAAT